MSIAFCQIDRCYSLSRITVASKRSAELVHCHRNSNPFGKLGGLEHQAKVAEVAAAMKTRGLQPVEREVKFDTPDGLKTSRFGDVVGYKNGKIAEIAQIGKINQNGTLVAREVRAATDINNSPTAEGTGVDFYGYNIKGPR